MNYVIKAVNRDGHTFWWTPRAYTADIGQATVFWIKEEALAIARDIRCRQTVPGGPRVVLVATRRQPPGPEVNAARLERAEGLLRECIGTEYEDGLYAIGNNAAFSAGRHDTSGRHRAYVEAAAGIESRVREFLKGGAT